MTRYPVNRLCPVTAEPHSEVLGYIPARLIRVENETYRSDFAEILGIDADDEFPIVRGPTGFIFSGWLATQDFLRKVYEDVIDHSSTITESVAYRRMQLEFGAAFLQIFQQLRHPAGKPLRLLDYGCGYGALLRMMEGRDIQCVGYEPSMARATRAAQDVFVITSDLDEVVSAGPFDLLVVTEVLEHVPEPRAILRWLRRNATPSALLAITVPNCESAFVVESMKGVREGRLPRVLNPWEHLNYFSAMSLRHLLTEEGFEVVNDFGRTRPALDACARYGDASLRELLLNGARITKRALTTAPSTELFCRLTRD